MAQSSTPRKTCFLGDICILCGFSFVSIETIDRKENIHKFYDVNIKLSKERIECVRKETKVVFQVTQVFVENVSGLSNPFSKLRRKTMPRRRKSDKA